jgi:hypothetical protein
MLNTLRWPRGSATRDDAEGGEEGLFKFGFTTRREGICKNDSTINPKLY